MNTGSGFRVMRKDTLFSVEDLVGPDRIKTTRDGRFLMVRRMPLKLMYVGNFFEELEHLVRD